MPEVYNVRINELQCHRIPQALSYTSFSIPHSDLERRRNYVALRSSLYQPAPLPSWSSCTIRLKCVRNKHTVSQQPYSYNFLTTSMQLTSVLTNGSLQSWQTAARHLISWDYGNWAPFVTSNADHEGWNHNAAKGNSRGWSQHVIRSMAGMKKYIRNHCQGVGTEFESERQPADSGSSSQFVQ